MGWAYVAKEGGAGWDGPLPDWVQSWGILGQDGRTGHLRITSSDESITLTNPYDEVDQYFDFQTLFEDDTPAAVAAAGAAGSATESARGDHVHAGVASLNIRTGATIIAAGVDISIVEDPQKTFTINFTGEGAGGVPDHGNLDGLADDDHPQYSLVTGARAFTGTVGGIDPVADSDLATKGYVDDGLDGKADAHEHPYIPLSIGDAKGDLVGFSANDTAVRIAGPTENGDDGKYLTVDYDGTTGGWELSTYRALHEGVFDAKGNLLAGTGNNAFALITPAYPGDVGKALTVNSGAATGWAFGAFADVGHNHNPDAAPPNVAAASAIGTATTEYANEDHTHGGVTSITKGAAAMGALTFAGDGVVQVGTTFTFAGPTSLPAGTAGDLLLYDAENGWQAWEPTAVGSMIYAGTATTWDEFVAPTNEHGALLAFVVGGGFFWQQGAHTRDMLYWDGTDWDLLAAPQAEGDYILKSTPGVGLTWVLTTGTFAKFAT